MKKIFEQWMDDVNDALLARVGLTSEDLPDYCYYDAYVDGTVICDVVDDVLDAADY